MLRSIISAIPYVAMAVLFGGLVGYLFGFDWRVSAGLVALPTAFFIGRDIWFWRNF